MGLYRSIPHNSGLQANEKLEERADKKIPSTDLVEMAEFILKNNFFEFETKIIQQISGKDIGIKFAAPDAICMFMVRRENDVLGSEIVKLWLWLRYIDDILFIWTEGEDPS